MQGLPVTIRTLDPPLHEFLPQDDKGQAEVAKALGVANEKIAERVKAMHQFNPMLGFRGCRLGIVYPEIIEMQIRAILEAACNVQKQGTKVELEIMIPLVGFLTEFQEQARVVHLTAKKVFADKGVTVPYLIGTMMELPRACLVADQIAREAQFFSFGTNDLTQTTLGMSRDDYGSFVCRYVNPPKIKDENGNEVLLPQIVNHDPFQSIDMDGVGGLHGNGRHQGPEHTSRPDSRHLRRARRRSRHHQVLPQDRLELRELQPVPAADRPAGGGSGGVGEVRNQLTRMEQRYVHQACDGTRSSRFQRQSDR